MAPTGQRRPGSNLEQLSYPDTGGDTDYINPQMRYQRASYERSQGDGQMEADQLRGEELGMGLFQGFDFSFNPSNISTLAADETSTNYSGLAYPHIQTYDNATTFGQANLFGFFNMNDRTPLTAYEPENTSPPTLQCSTSSLSSSSFSSPYPSPAGSRAASPPGLSSGLQAPSPRSAVCRPLRSVPEDWQMDSSRCVVCSGIPHEYCKKSEISNFFKTVNCSIALGTGYNPMVSVFLLCHVWCA